MQGKEAKLNLMVEPASLAFVNQQTNMVYCMLNDQKDFCQEEI